MSDPQIFEYMSRMSSDKLTEILQLHDQNEWVEDAFLAAEEILTQRRNPSSQSKNSEQHSNGNHWKAPQPENKEGKENSKSAYAVMTCVFCPTELRLPITEGRYRCPTCQMCYALKLLSRSPLIYLIAQAEPAKTSYQPPPPKKEKQKMPTPEVQSAFLVLELTSNSTLIEARANYRKMIQSCHPDKVSHLDRDIKAAAEHKTKKLNEAIFVITSFFKST